MIHLVGYLQGYDGNTLTIVAPFHAGEHTLMKQEITECEVVLRDGRSISPIQRQHIYACMRDIAKWSGHLPDEIKQFMKYDFISKSGCAEFSLRDCDMTTARAFLTYLIGFIVQHGVPSKDSMLDRCEDIQAYLYVCIVNVKCAVCGGRADMHEWERVGMGRNRQEIPHTGQLVQPLCREHHGKCHNIGQQTFDQKYHLEAIRLDDHLMALLHERLGWKE